MRRKTTIVQCGGGWPTNIGNAFIDLGSMYTLNRAREYIKLYKSLYDEKKSIGGQK